MILKENYDSGFKNFGYGGGPPIYTVPGPGKTTPVFGPDAPSNPNYGAEGGAAERAYGRRTPSQSRQGSPLVSLAEEGGVSSGVRGVGGQVGAGAGNVRAGNVPPMAISPFTLPGSSSARPARSTYSSPGSSAARTATGTGAASPTSQSGGTGGKKKASGAAANRGKARKAAAAYLGPPVKPPNPSRRVPPPPHR